MSRAKLTVLTENSTHQAGLMAEHGWSVWIEWGEENFLFDTGQTGLWRENAKRLNLSWSRLSGVILSHGHYDHTGGLPALGELPPQTRIFLHPDALSGKYSVPRNSPARFIGMSQGSRAWLERQGDRIQFVTAPLELAPGLWLSGPIPRSHSFEDVGGPFFLDADGASPDPLWDDMALGLVTRDGLVVLLGCAHAGVVNTMDHLRSVLGNPPIHTVCGGMHLLQASPERMAATLSAFEDYKIQRLGVAHCTSFAAAVALSQRFPGKCFVPHVGTVMEFCLS